MKCAFQFQFFLSGKFSLAQLASASLAWFICLEGSVIRNSYFQLQWLLEIRSQNYILLRKFFLKKGLIPPPVHGCELKGFGRNWWTAADTATILKSIFSKKRYYVMPTWQSHSCCGCKFGFGLNIFKLV